MKSSRSILATTVLFLLGGIVLLWWLVSAAGTIRITYKGSQWDAKLGSVGVFEVVNDTKIAMNSGHGVYERRSGRGWVHGLGDYGADLGGVHTFAPGSTNRLTIWIPTNGGSYRLVLQCNPDLPNGTARPAQWRWRLAQVMGYLRAPSRLQGRALGNKYPASQQFMGTIAQPDGPANGSQPTDRDPSPTPPAAGFRR
jgi:hypothetical protein